ncbi:ketopantoate reductase family protein [Methanofollis fontis]|uniref:2-dehydropantoate 2-reductase n=1 Tax=Methanofollis fontis TaxID=2052832 RepID=A0A483CTD3_9EURY|nr:2-dehydropantoate 2-reductase [Methanofollis fontis]TAJ43944.1 2-dehydropantoate 2-reductase [Methanofollis fontis]
MEDAQRPVVLILGAGAVGLALAGKLADVADVYAACRHRHASAIREGGLVMDGIWGDRTVGTLSCITGPAELSVDPDLVVVTAKGTDTESICREYAAVMGGRSVVTLQNGIGNEDRIARYTDRIIGGTVTTNFAVVGPGHVRVSSQSAPVVLGTWSGPADLLPPAIDLFERAGIPVAATADIRAEKWAKSLLNIAVNPLCALLSVQVGAAASPHLRGVIEGLIQETYAVMEAEGIRVRWRSADEYLDHLFGVQVPDFSTVYPSMYYDIQNRRRTEIDLLNGYVVALGERQGIPTPYNRCIAGLIRFREEGR